MRLVSFTWISPLAAGLCLFLSAPSPARSESLDGLHKQWKEHYSAGRYDEAERVARLCVDMTEAKSMQVEPAHSVGCLVELALTLRAQAHPAVALSLYDRALVIAEKTMGREHRNVASVLNNMASAYGDLGRYADAVKLSERALAIFERARQHLDVARTLNNLALTYEVQNRYAEALPIYERVLVVFERELGRDHLEVARTLHNMGVVYWNQGHHAKAIPLYERALEIRKKALGSEHPAVADTLNNLGIAYQVQGRYAEALRLYEQALTIYQGHGQEPSVGQTLDNMAVVHWDQGRYAEALRLLEAALATREKALGPEHPYVAATLDKLASVHAFQGRFAEAQLLYERALTVYENAFGSEHSSATRTLSNLALMYHVKGKYADALAYFHRATTILGSRAEIAERAAVDRGDAQSDPSGAFGGLAAAAFDLALEQPANRENLSNEAFVAAQGPRQTSASAALAQMAARFATGDTELAKIVREQQDLKAQWRVLDQALLATISKTPSQRDTLTEDRLRDQRKEIELSIGKNRQLLEAKFADYGALANPKPLSIDETQKLLGADEVLVAYLWLPMSLMTDHSVMVWALTRDGLDWQRVQIDNTELAERVATLRDSLELAEVKRALDDEEARTRALTDKVQALRCGLDDAEWDGIGPPARCNKLLGVGLPGEKDPLPFSFAIAHELYEALLGPVKDLIRDKHVLIVPSGPLTSLPFQVLVTEPPKVPIGLAYDDYRDVAWLARTQAITVLPSVASLKALRSHAGASPANAAYVGYGDPVLIGNPACRGGADVAETCPGSAQEVKVASLSPRRERGGRRSAGLDRVFRKGASQEAVLTEVRALCPLPDTAQEIRCVAQSLGVPDSEIRLKETATEGDIKGLNESGKLATYKVIHFATHGLLAGDVAIMAKRQGEPSLVLTPPEAKTDDEDDNGLLTASEVAQLKLNADWVILSACNTAAGEKLGAEALSGLARAFFYAGTRALLVSHWPVYSDAAVRLITGTFAELEAHPEIGRAEAQRRAMIALMSDPTDKTNPHPAVWAPFVVVGEGAAEQ